jgi:hypothetical protein
MNNSITINSKNVDVLQAYKDELATGFPVVFAVREAQQSAKGNMYLAFNVMQLKTIASNLSEFTLMAAGLTATIPVRCYIPVKEEVYKSDTNEGRLLRSMTQGKVLENFKLVTIDTQITPKEPKRSIRERPTEGGMELLLFDGKPIYRTVQLASLNSSFEDSIITPNSTKFVGDGDDDEKEEIISFNSISVEG